MSVRILTLALLVLPLGACASSAPARIDDALLSELRPAEMDRIAEARAERDRAADVFAKARRDSRWAEEQVGLARSSLKVARARLEESKLAVATAEESGTVSQHEEAALRNDYFVAAAEEARHLLALRKRERDAAQLDERLRLEEMRLSDTRVELAKAEAVSELDRMAAKRVAVKDYRKQVRYHETEVELARVHRSALDVELEEAEAAYEERRQQSDELRAAAGVVG